jgi:hypothetical protein
MSEPCLSLQALPDHGLVNPDRRQALIAGAALTSVTALPPSGAWAQAQGESTYSGAIRAGNAEGSIPAYSGGLMKPPAGFDPKRGYMDPFASDKPLFVVNASNLNQHRPLLSEGVAALLAKERAFVMPVYPTHRTAGIPDHAIADVQAERGQIRLEGSAIIGRKRSTVPFPEPRSGEEAMLNFLLRYGGGGFEREYSWFPVRPDGGTYRVGYADRVVYADQMDPSQSDSGLLLAFTSRYTAPGSLAGTVYLVHEFVDPIRQPRAAWVYSAAQRRVRRAPDLAYDNVADGTEGMRVTDQYFGFNGALDRYDWKLIGRKEMLVPYNTYRIGDKALKYTDIVRKGSANSELMRYERHRVWVVEATLKAGSKHIYGKRVFHFDEDSWALLIEDCYDNRGAIWRVGVHGFVQAYDHGVPWYSVQMWHDLNSGSVLISHLDNEVTTPVRFGIRARWSEFQTDALRRMGAS